jgi:hypothetical protein
MRLTDGRGADLLRVDVHREYLDGEKAAKFLDNIAN